MFGQILIGLSQPFCLSAPTKYSDEWFSGRGRTSATALATLANPLGGAIGQLVGGAWASKPSDIPNMVLYVSIIVSRRETIARCALLIVCIQSSVASLPSFFLPSRPPAPPSASAAAAAAAEGETDLMTAKGQLIGDTIQLLGQVEFWLIFFCFSVYVGFFNSVSSLVNQILEPYNFTETEASIAGAILILAGLVFAAITSPIIDRSKHYLFTIKILVPIVAASYIGLIFCPGSSTHSIVPSYIVFGIMGASSFALLPVTLEFLVEISYPFASPEIGSTICWTGGQLFGAIFIIVQDALKAGPRASPPQNMRNALIFSAVVSAVTAPLAICIGLFGRVVRRRRLEAEQAEVSVLDHEEPVERGTVNVVNPKRSS